MMQSRNLLHRKWKLRRFLVAPARLPTLLASHIYDRGFESEGGSAGVLLRLRSSVQRECALYYRQRDWDVLQESLTRRIRSVFDRDRIAEIFRRLWSMCHEVLPEVENEWWALYAVTFDRDDLDSERRRRAAAGELLGLRDDGRNDPVSRLLKVGKMLEYGSGLTLTDQEIADALRHVSLESEQLARLSAVGRVFSDLIQQAVETLKGVRASPNEALGARQVLAQVSYAVRRYGLSGG